MNLSMLFSGSGLDSLYPHKVAKLQFVGRFRHGQGCSLSDHLVTRPSESVAGPVRT